MISMIDISIPYDDDLDGAFDDYYSIDLSLLCDSGVLSVVVVVVFAMIIDLASVSTSAAHDFFSLFLLIFVNSRRPCRIFYCRQNLLFFFLLFFCSFFFCFVCHHLVRFLIRLCRRPW